MCSRRSRNEIYNRLNFELKLDQRNSTELNSAQLTEHTNPKLESVVLQIFPRIFWNEYWLYHNLSFILIWKHNFHRNRQTHESPNFPLKHLLSCEPRTKKTRAFSVFVWRLIGVLCAYMRRIWIMRYVTFEISIFQTIKLVWNQRFVASKTKCQQITVVCVFVFPISIFPE